MSRQVAQLFFITFSSAGITLYTLGRITLYVYTLSLERTFAQAFTYIRSGMRVPIYIAIGGEVEIAGLIGEHAKDLGEKAH